MAWSLCCLYGKIESHMFGVQISPIPATNASRFWQKRVYYEDMNETPLGDLVAV